MQILIPFAIPPHPACQGALQTLELPNLRRLLQVLTLQNSHQGQPDDLTPLHERLLWLLQGHTLQDGLTGAAARAAQERGLYQADDVATKQGWAFITLCHWDIHAQHVQMADPLQLKLSQEEADALLRTMQPYFAEDGITLHPYQRGTWLAQGAVLYQLPTASLYRVSNQIVNDWIPRQPQAKVLRRLQNEMQMLLYTHPINDARAQHGAQMVNSFWVSDTGAVNPQPPDVVHVEHSLLLPATQDRASDWCQAWNVIDSTLLQQALLKLQQGQNLQMTLSSELRAITFAHTPLSWWQTLRRSLQNPSVYTQLQPLFGS